MTFQENWPAGGPWSKTMKRIIEIGNCKSNYRKQWKNVSDHVKRILVKNPVQLILIANN